MNPTQKACTVNASIKDSALRQLKTVRRNSKTPEPTYKLRHNYILAEANCHRKAKLTDTTVHAKTKNRLHKLCNEYMKIFSKNSTSISKTDWLQMTLIPKDHQTLWTKVICVTLQTSCRVHKRADIEKTRHHIPLYLKFCIPHHHSFKERDTSTYGSHIQNDSRL